MEKETKKKRARRGSVTYGIFIVIYALALAAAAGYVLKHYVWTYAEQYEASRITPVIEAYMDGLRDNLIAGGITETIQAMPHRFQTDEECAQVVEEMLDGDLSYTRQTGGGDRDNTAVFNLLCGQNLIGRVTLVQDESKADEVMMNLLPWKVQGDEFYLDGLYTAVQVTVPEGYSVQINGHTLDESYIVETGIHYDVLEPYYEEFPNLPTKVTYHAEEIFGQVEPVILDRKGEIAVIDPEQDDSQFIDPADDATLQRLAAFSVEFAKRYLAFSASVQDMTYLYQMMLPYVVIDSDIDVRMKQAIDGQYGYSHTTSYQFGEAWLNSVTPLGNGYYIVDMTATATTLQPSGTHYVERNLRVTCIDKAGDIRAVTAEDY